MNSSHPNAPGRRRRSATPSLGTLATTAVVAYGTYKLVNWAWGAWSDGREEEDATHEPSLIGGALRGVLERPLNYGARWQSQRQQQHLQWRLRRQRVERCRAETAKALTDFLPTMRRTIEELTDTTRETRDLKLLRAEKRNQEGPSVNDQYRQEQERELWDAIKVKTMTRMMSTAYAHTILFLVLTVQVHVIGGRLFEEQTNKSSSTEGGMGTSLSSLGNRSHETSASVRMGSYQASHRMVLTGTYDYFFDRGISYLVQSVKRAVSEVMDDWNVMDAAFMSVSREKLNEAIHRIRDIVEGRSPRCRTRSRRSQSRQMRQRSIIRFLLPPEQGLDEIMSDALARSVLEETWDLLESPVLEDAESDCLHVTFDVMKSQHWDKIFVEMNGNNFVARIPAQWTTKPLANVITQLRRTTNSFYEVSSEPSANLFSLQQGCNMYCSALERIPTVLELGDVSFN